MYSDLLDELNDFVNMMETDLNLQKKLGVGNEPLRYGMPSPNELLSYYINDLKDIINK